jgi:hypothetical protein
LIKEKNFMYKEINCCRSCQSNKLIEVLSLGNLAVSNFVENPVSQTGIKAPLDLLLCDPVKGGCGLLQLHLAVTTSSATPCRGRG